MAKRSKADPLNKMIHMASELQRHAKNMAKEDSPTFRLHTAKFADAVRDRLLKGIAHGYDIRGKQFKHHKETTTKIRRLKASGPSQFGGGSDDALALEAAYKAEGISSPSRAAKTIGKIGGYTFDASPGGTILYDGRNAFGGNDIVSAIGDTLEKGKVVVAEKTSIKIKADSLHEYQKAQHTGFIVRKNKKPNGVANKFNFVGKRVPAREWLGVPVTYRENHPGWKKAMGILAETLDKEYGRIIKGGKSNLNWYKKSKEGNQKWQDQKKKAK